VQWLLHPSATVKVAGKSGISQARGRLGTEPLKQMYETVVAPIAEKRTQGAWYRQRRPVSLDGSTLDVADEAENDRAFGRPGASRGSSAYPKIRSEQYCTWPRPYIIIPQHNRARGFSAVCERL
jgi:hypothetical protein